MTLNYRKYVYTLQYTKIKQELKNLKLLLIIASGTIFQAQAQYDLDYSNNTNCAYTVDVSFDDGSGSCNPCAVSGITVSATSSGTVTSCHGSAGQAYKIRVTDACSKVVTLSDQLSTTCSSTNIYSANLPQCGACIFTVTVTFTPSNGTSNASITIN